MGRLRQLAMAKGFYGIQARFSLCALRGAGPPVSHPKFPPVVQPYDTALAFGSSLSLRPKSSFRALLQKIAGRLSLSAPTRSVVLNQAATHCRLSNILPARTENGPMGDVRRAT
jgi:hypothetical protein